VETLDTPISSAPERRSLSSRPRRRLADAPPAPADPGPWQYVLGEQALSPADLNLLMHLAKRRVIPAGCSVFGSDLQAHSLVLLLSGDVVLGSRATDGSLRTERSVTGPAWLDLSAAWLSVPYEMEALALSDAVVAELRLDELCAELQTHPQLALCLCMSLARRVHELTAASRNLLHNDAPARFAQWLLQRCLVESGPVELRLQERKRDIAQQLAMTPETLSRLMRSFETRGVIDVRGYVVQVHDVVELRKLAGGRPGV
jgi:CRP-like cAMP-binding protein